MISDAHVLGAGPARPRPRMGAGAAVYAGSIQWRWLLLATFPVGYLLAQDAYGGALFALENVLAFLALAVVLTGMTGHVVTDMPVWVILATFLLGYYVKFYAIGWTIANNGDWVFETSFEDAARNIANAQEAFRMITYGFLAACATLTVLQHKRAGKIIPLSKGRLARSERARETALQLLPRATVAVLLLLLVTGYAQYALGVGVMGREDVVLPYHLSGLIFHPRERLIPAFLLFLLWLADYYDLEGWVTTILLVLLVHAVTQSFIQASRGQLFYAFIPVACLWIGQRRFTRGRITAVIAVLLLATALHPLITGLRFLRVVEGDNLSFGTILAARENIQLVTESSSSFLLTGLLSIVNRVSGTDTLLFATLWPYPDALSPSAIHFFFLNPSGLSLARVITQNVAGFGADEFAHSIDPTLVGTGVLIGGVMGVVLLCSLWALFVHRMLAWLAAARFRTAPVIWAAFASWLFLQTAAFTILDNFYWPVFAISGLALGEHLARKRFPAASGNKPS